LQNTERIVINSYTYVYSKLTKLTRHYHLIISLQTQKVLCYKNLDIIKIINFPV